MSLTTFDNFLENLSPENRAEVLASPREERLIRLADLLECSEPEALERISEETSLPILPDWEMHDEPAKQIHPRLIHEYKCLPIQLPPEVASEPGTLPLITAWPPTDLINEWIYTVTGKHPAWHLARPGKIIKKITEKFGVGASTLGESELDELIDGDTEDTEAEDENAAIIRFVNEIITQAIKDRATDIHFEPQKETLQIRYRIDGELVPVSLPHDLVRFQGAIISRLKIMARLNISEKRRPQDGRITFDGAGQSLDIRMSSLPTMYGESISLRLLSQRAQPLTIQELGFLPEDEAAVGRTLGRPHGIILVTGPTGSGKSTTLTAFMRKINTPARRIITVEDPVEYEVEGINQTQVRHEIGLNFSSVLRTVLRQDPDVIMVGEIRDQETAEIAIRAALTGHLVLSTLHTNDAPGALTRLIDMDIEPFLVASSVEMIIAQRLVRRLCHACQQPAELEPGQLETALAALGLPASEAQFKDKLFAPSGCERCRGLGFRGRVAITEILRASEAIHELIVHKDSARIIRDQAVSEGMRTLQQSGWEQVKRGITSLNEIMKFADIIDTH